METPGIGFIALIVVAIVEAIFGGLGAWVAGQKYRDRNEGFWLGFWFGPLGVVVEGLLPTLPKPGFTAPRPDPTPKQSAPKPGARSDDDPVPTPPVPVRVPPRAGSRLRKPLGEEWVPEFPEDTGTGSKGESKP